MPTIHHELRYLLPYVAAYSLPSLVISAGCGYGIFWADGTEIALFFIIGLIIMGIVFVGISGTNIWWLVQASRLLATRQPAAMTLTANRGWSEITLSPVNPGDPSLSGVEFITMCSGVKRTEQHATPVWVYTDQALSDLVVMRFRDRLLVSENRQRMNQGGSNSISRQVMDVEGKPAIPEAAPENPRILEDLAVITRDITGRMRVMQIGLVAILLLAAIITGYWQVILRIPRLIVMLTHGALPDTGSLMEVGIAALAVVGVVYAHRYLSRLPKLLARGQTVVQTTPPVQRRLRTAIEKKDNNVEITIAVHDPAVETDPLFAIELYSDFSETQAADVNGTLGLVYATNPDEPVVIQTVSGLVVGKRKG